ncbi:MAG: ribose 5-phosphate isomerase B [Candidatus Rokuibacteriota bacterium]
MTVIALGADHAGFALKEELKLWLAARGHEVLDFGTNSAEVVDYPDYAVLVARAVSRGSAVCGVLVCGTGIGMAIAANKVVGARAAVCADAEAARMSREHNDANIITLGARVLPREGAFGILEIWLKTDFAGGRHVRRVEKLAALEGLARNEGPRASAR